MSKFLGRSCVMEFFRDGQWRTFACARTNAISWQTEMMETSVAGAGKYATFLPTKNSGTVTGDGVMAIETGMISFAEIRAMQLAHTRVRFRYTRTSITSQFYTETFYGYFESTDDNGSFDDLSLFSFSARIDGPLTQSFTVNPTTGNKVYRYPEPGDTHPVAIGTTTITLSLLINKDILAVHKDGIGNNDIILTGAPAAKEVLYDATTGDFTWAIPFEADENFYILYQDL